MMAERYKNFEIVGKRKNFFSIQISHATYLREPSFFLSSNSFTVRSTTSSNW